MARLQLNVSEKAPIWSTLSLQLDQVEQSSLSGVHNA